MHPTYRQKVHIADIIKTSNVAVATYLPVPPAVTVSASV